MGAELAVLLGRGFSQWMFTRCDRKVRNENKTAPF